MIGYLGQEGSYSYFASKTLYRDNELIPYNNLGRLFYALSVDEVTGIIVPFENSKDGTNFEVLGRLLKTHDHIYQEVILDIELQVVSKNTNPSLITGIFGREDCINDGYNTLKTEYGKYKKNYVRTDRDAVTRIIRNESNTFGALVTNYERLDNLHVLSSNVRDTKQNLFKFIEIRKNLVMNGAHDRIFVALSPKFNKMGALYDLLHEFVLRQINILKILSQPMHNPDNDTILYLECEGNTQDKNVKDAIQIIRHKSKFISILGSYKGR